MKNEMRNQRSARSADSAQHARRNTKTEGIEIESTNRQVVDDRCTRGDFSAG